jgi:DUF1680 family protein
VRIAPFPAACCLAIAFVLPAFPKSATEVRPEPQSVIALGHSLNAQLQPVPVSAVKLPDGFWGTRTHLIIERALPALRQQLEANGTIDNFLRLSGKKNVPRRGRPSSDADLYEWIQAAAWANASPETSVPVKQKLQADIDGLVSAIAAAQDSTGYLDTYFTGERAHLRFTDILHSHEDDCLGHLLLAGIACYRATQNRTLLDVGVRFANNVLANFGPSLRPFIAAHTKLISALVELYRTVGDTRYLDFALYLLGGSERDRLHLKDSDVRYFFSGRPFTSRTEFEGQAVNALEAAVGATDYFAESGDPAYKQTLDVLWDDLNARRITVTGAPATRNNSDVIAEPYDVGSGSPAVETQAAAANARWNLRLLALTGDARYADMFETALYNAVSASLSQTGGFSCGHGVLVPAEKARSPYYETETCPPDTLSLFTTIGSYIYAARHDGIYINLFNDSELSWHLQDGTPLRVVQATNYPWDGEVKITLYPARAAQFALHIRWPSWAPALEVSINGLKVDEKFQPGTFATLSRKWQPGDVVTLNIPMNPVLLRANQRAADLWQRTAVKRGPIVYSLQQVDQGSLPVMDLFLRANSPGTVDFHKELMGGFAYLKYPGFATDRSASQPLYSPWKDAFLQARRPVALTFAPYFAIGSRDSDASELWVPVLRGVEPQNTGSGATRPPGFH